MYSSTIRVEASTWANPLFGLRCRMMSGIRPYLDEFEFCLPCMSTKLLIVRLFRCIIILKRCQVRSRILFRCVWCLSLVRASCVFYVILSCALSVFSVQIIMG
jgi:hypothetical protein